MGQDRLKAVLERVNSRINERSTEWRNEVDELKKNFFSRSVSVTSCDSQRTSLSSHPTESPRDVTMTPRDVTMSSQDIVTLRDVTSTRDFKISPRDITAATCESIEKAPHETITTTPRDNITTKWDNMKKTNDVTKTKNNTTKRNTFDDILREKLLINMRTLDRKTTQESTTNDRKPLGNTSHDNKTHDVIMMRGNNALPGNNTTIPYNSTKTNDTTTKFPYTGTRAHDTTLTNDATTLLEDINSLVDSSSMSSDVFVIPQRPSSNTPPLSFSLLSLDGSTDRSSLTDSSLATPLYPVPSHPSACDSLSSSLSSVGKEDRLCVEVFDERSGSVAAFNKKNSGGGIQSFSNYKNVYNNNNNYGNSNINNNNNNYGNSNIINNNNNFNINKNFLSTLPSCFLQEFDLGGFEAGDVEVFVEGSKLKIKAHQSNCGSFLL